jgi:hypothetical protein
MSFETVVKVTLPEKRNQLDSASSHERPAWV